MFWQITLKGVAAAFSKHCSYNFPRYYFIKMSETFVDLLPELQKYIFSYCNTASMIDFACCCTQFNDMVRHLLFRHVNIQWSSLRDSAALSKKLRNFKFSSSLVFSESTLGIQPMWWHEISYSYFSILKLCHPDKLTTLHLSEVDNDVLVRTLTICDNLQELEVSYYYSRSNNLHDLRKNFSSDFSSSCWKKLTTILTLRRLSIYSCNVTDNDIANISKHPTLQELVIDNSSCLSRYSLQSICTMVQLKKLLYKGTTGFEDIIKLLNLTDLDISDTSIENNVFAEICSSSLALKSLALHNCYKLNDVAFFSLSMQLTLQKLDVSGDMVTDLVLHHVSTLAQLTDLNLASCAMITDEGIQCLTSLTNLHWLNISYCYLLTNISLVYLSALPISYLSATACKITDEGMLYASMMSHLKELDITKCVSVSENGLSNIALLRLNVLKLTRVRFTNCMLDRFCGSTGMFEERLSCENRTVHLTLKR